MAARRLALVMLAAMLMEGADAGMEGGRDQFPLIPRTALFGSEMRSFARLSPDGRHIAFIAPSEGVPNIWLGSMDDLPTARPVTGDKRHGVNAFFWAFDSRHLLFFQDEDGNGVYRLYSVDIETRKQLDLVPLENATVSIRGEDWFSPERPGTVLVMIGDGNSHRADLYEVDVATGQRRLVLPADEHDFQAYYVDGKLRPLVGHKFLAGGGNEIYRYASGWKSLLRWEGIDVGTTRPLSVEAGAISMLMLSSIGRDKAALVRVDLATGKQTVLAEDPQASVVDVWTHPRTGQLDAYTTQYLMRKANALTPEATHDIAHLEHALGKRFTVPSRSLDNRRWIVEVNDPVIGVSSHLYDRATGKLTELFSTFPQLAGAPLQPLWPIEIPARDGLTLVSYLTLPPGSDPAGRGRPRHRVPLVLTVHPGPSSRDEYSFRNDHQWLANRGYAVLSVNFRGSTGLGKRFFNAGALEMGGKMQDDLLDAVNWAVREKIADPEKVAIVGESYGGYAALAGLAFTPERFACGIDIVGPSDLLGMFETPNARTLRPIYEAAVSLMGDPADESVRSRLRQRSPLTHADRVVRPLLVAHGANDPAVPRDQSDRFVAAMKAGNRPVTYVLYPDEGHGMHRPQNRLSFQAVSEAFLAKCLGGRAEPFGDDLKGSTMEVIEGVEHVAGLEQAMRRASAHEPPDLAQQGSAGSDGR